MERVIARLPGTAALGEVRYLWDRGVLEDQRCGCGAAFRECPFWGQVGRAAFGGWDPQFARRMREVRDEYDRARHVPALLVRSDRGRWAQPVLEQAAAYAAVYRAAAAAADATWVLDSSKHVSLPYILSRSKDIDVTVLHLVRDPRGVAYSWSKDVVRPEITDRVELMPHYSAAQVARTWLVHNGAVAPVRRRGVRVHRIRYEDFIERPVETMSGIAGLLGVEMPRDLAAGLADGDVDLPADHTVAGNPSRFRTGRLELHRDRAWTQSLPW